MCPHTPLRYNYLFEHCTGFCVRLFVEDVNAQLTFVIRCAAQPSKQICNYCFLSMRQYQVQLCFMSYPCWQFNRGSLDILLNIIRTSQCAPGKPIKFAAKNNSLYLINCKEKSLEFNFSDRLLGALYVLCLLLSVKLDFSCVDICVDAKRELISLALLLSCSLLFTESLPYSCLKLYLMKSIWNKPTYNYLALIKGLSACWKWNLGLQMACLCFFSSGIN